MVRLFLDTEFTDLRQNASLISLAVISGDGFSFYAEFTDYKKSAVSTWTSENVIAHLQLEGKKAPFLLKGVAQWDVKGGKKTVAKKFTKWLEQWPAGTQFEIWADVLAWDWVLFCEMFGGAMKIPSQIFYIPADLSTLLRLKGIDPDIGREKYAWKGRPPEGFKKHHALWDAKLCKACYEKTIAL